MNDKSSILTEISRINDENKLLEIFEDNDDFNMRYSIVKLIDDDSILYEIFSKEKDPFIKSIALNRISSDIPDYDDFNSLDMYEKITYIENHSNESLFFEVAEKDKNFHVRTAAIYKIQDRDFLLEMADGHSDYDTRVVLYKKLNNKSLLEEITGENLTESRVGLVKNLDNEKFIKDMGINDSNSDVRIAAVERVDDEKFLKDIAINDSSSKIRILALKKLNKPHFYFRFANDLDYDDEIEIIENIKDESELMDVAIFFSQDASVVENAINNIANPSILFELYRRGSNHIRKTAMKKLVFGNVFSHEKIADKISIGHMILSVCDENVLVDIARNDSSWNVHLEAIRKIDDKTVLADIAKNDPNSYVRKNATKKINDKDVLTSITKNDPNSDVRKTAVEKINDENVLADIARNDSDWEVRREAVQRINDQDVLTSIAKNDPNSDVRITAVEKINDENVLADIVINDSNIKVQRTAVENINDENVLADIARNMSNNNVFSGALHKIDYDNVLADIARNDSSWNVCLEAVRSIRNQDVLIELAINDLHYYLKEVAVRKINDENVLVDIARNDPYSDIRKAAVEKIDDENVLADILRKDDNPYVRIAALEKIRDGDSLQKLLLENFGYLPVASFTAFKRNYNKTIYEQMGTGLYMDILDRISDESVFIDLIHERLFGDFRVLIVRRLVSPDALRDLALNDLDYRVRLEAVKNPNLCDEETFAEIVQSDHNDAVRLEALRRIDDRDMLEDIATDLNPAMRLHAFERLGKDIDFDKHYAAFEDIDLSSVKSIEDENMLYCIANDAPSAPIRRYAFDKIRDEHILADLVCHNREFMNMALSKITDNSLLLNIALYCNDKDAKRKAVKKIDDEELLFKAVQSNPYNDISEYIVDRIRDESLLEIIAFNNSNPFNRKAAVNKIKSQDILTRLGEVECEEVVCTAIVRRCRDKSLLEYIGLSNPCKTVRRYVGSVTDDDELLYRFALKEIEYDNRRELISRLDDEEYVLNLLKKETVDNVFRRDFKITDTELLIDLAKNAVSDNAKRYAMNHMDQSVLEDFIYSSPFISRGPKSKSVWEGYQYHDDDIGLCLSIMSSSDFNDLQLIEDFLIENRIEYGIYSLKEKVTEIASIYRIVLNCKSQEVRKLFKTKLEYATKHQNDRHDRDGDVTEEEEAMGLGALFG